MYGRGWHINGAERLATLRDLGIFGTAAEPEFDRLTAETAERCAAPFAIVNLIEADRQYFKSQHGGTLDEPAIEDSICTHCLEQGSELVIPDLSLDDRTRNAPVVANEPHLRFYAGVPIVVRGQGVGVLAVMDSRPRPEGLTSEQSWHLARIAERTAQMIEARPLVLDHS